MEYQLSTWKHPATGQTRIYLRHPEIESGDKCFIEQAPPSQTNPGGWRGVIQSIYIGSYTGSRGFHRGTSRFEIGNYYADEALRERGWHKATFASIVAAIEGRGEIVEAPPVGKPAPTPAEIERAEILASLPPRLSAADRIAAQDRAVALARRDEDTLRAFATIKWSKARLKADRAIEDEVIAARFSESIGCGGLSKSDVEECKGRLWKKIANLEKA